MLRRLRGHRRNFHGLRPGLKKHKPEIRCYLIEPHTVRTWPERRISNPSHQIQGGGYNMDLPFLERSFVHDYVQVSDEEAIETTRALARKEGIFAGFSSGANVAAALRLLQEREKGATIALTINDSGLKYLSTELF